MAHKNRLPVTVAVVLTVAAAVSIADEHTSSLAAAERAIASFDSGARMGGREAHENAGSSKDGHAGKGRGADDAATGVGAADKPSGVGSRALQGNDADCLRQPEMATGAGLPVRPPASRTPE